MTDHPGCLETETAEYLPFGLTRKQTGTEVTYYKFTDQEYDSEVGLYNYNARLYDPAAGIFISPDSIVPDWNDPQSLNRFAYARNNPLKYNDPDGHAASLAIRGVIGAVIGGGVNFTSNWGDYQTGKLTKGEFALSVLNGMLLGGLSAYTGPYGGALLGGINNVLDSTEKDEEISPEDLAASIFD